MATLESPPVIEQFGGSKTEYVLGFLFSLTGNHVALIRKTKPDWQAGKYNGIGGKIEPNESPMDAMRREFKEETGATVTHWTPVGSINFGDCVVHVFTASYAGINIQQTTEEEEPMWVRTLALPDNRLPNLDWLIPMCLQKLKHPASWVPAIMRTY